MANGVLSEHVEVDGRVGLGENGIYQEPLERVLEYIGLSMTQDQTPYRLDNRETSHAILGGARNSGEWRMRHEADRVWREDRLHYR